MAMSLSRCYGCLADGLRRHESARDAASTVRDAASTVRNDDGAAFQGDDLDTIFTASWPGIFPRRCPLCAHGWSLPHFSGG